MERVRRDGSGIIRVNLVAADGTIIYSDRPAIRGQVVVAADDTLLASALSGRVASARDSLTGTENVDLKPQYAKAIEVYVPVVLDGRVVGAYEVYHDLGISTAVEVAVWVFVAVAIVVLAHAVARSVVVSGTPRAGGRVIECQPVPPGAFSRLTARELEVLELLATTHSYRDIAARLSVSDETVRSHVKRILHKLGQPDRTQAVMAAIKAGLLQLS
jgi:DNA-binding CsgD family transcriptional regulator